MNFFDWTEYLDNNKRIAIPETLFGHVEASLNNGIKQDMLLEVCHKNNPDIYWIAEITMVCGHLLRMKFIGAKSDFWYDITNTKVHPLGWCPKYEELIEPPDEIAEAYGDTIIDMMKEALSNRMSVSEDALQNKGLSPIDRIKPGMKVEVQNVIDPYRYWIATVCENIGGRLQLRYDGSDEDIEKFWIFFSNPRLCSFGYVTNKGSPWQFKYPGKINKFSCKNKLSAQLRLCAEESIKDPTPNDLFQPSHSFHVHNFIVGMKLEALDPHDMKSVRPATVVKVFNNFNFLVAIDDHINDYEESKMAWLCDSVHPYIYPIGWAQKHSIPFTVPKIWVEETFDWDEYLSLTSSVPVPEYCFEPKEPIKDIEPDMMLEAVNPLNDEEIHVATVKCVIEHMMCVELLPIGESYWCSQSADTIFPVGWCDSNNYELHIPDPNAVRDQRKKSPETPPKEDASKPTEVWCDRIYFNYKCFCGYTIGKNRISELPKHVGPGPLSLVIREVLKKVISASFKPTKLLRDWETEGPAPEGMRLETLKAKLKTSTHYATVAVPTLPSQVASFCRSMCMKLNACPNVFGPVDYTEHCPENCKRNKDKFRAEEKRRGRPRGSVKKKKKKAPSIKGQPPPEIKAVREDADSAESEHSGTSSPRSEPGTRATSPESTDDKKRCLRNDSKSRQPKSEMKTRGAKLPNFALQIREAHWHRKDVETMYNHSLSGKKQSFHGSDTENESSRSTNSRDKQISDVSDSEEPELKKLKFVSEEPQPTDNKMFESDISVSWLKGKLKLSPNPLDWTVDDVYVYLSSTEDCKLIAERMRQEEIDGQAFIMLDLATIREFLHMKQEFALRLCKHIAMIKWYYVVHFEEGVIEV